MKFVVKLNRKKNMKIRHREEKIEKEEDYQKIILNELHPKRIKTILFFLLIIVFSFTFALIGSTVLINFSIIAALLWICYYSKTINKRLKIILELCLKELEK